MMRILCLGARIVAVACVCSALFGCSSKETSCVFEVTREIGDASVMDSGKFWAADCERFCGQAVTTCEPVSGQASRVECEPFCLQPVN
jgi:hypothetical protein